MIAPILAAMMAGQTAPAVPPSPPVAPPSVLSLEQLTIALGGGDTPDNKTKVERFRAATKTIASCAMADEVAAQLGATIVKKDTFLFSDLPKPLQDELTSLPVGHATPLFGAGDHVRVLVLCRRD